MKINKIKKHRFIVDAWSYRTRHRIESELKVALNHGYVVGAKVKVHKKKPQIKERK